MPLATRYFSFVDGKMPEVNLDLARKTARMLAGSGRSRSVVPIPRIGGTYRGPMASPRGPGGGTQLLLNLQCSHPIAQGPRPTKLISWHQKSESVHQISRSR